MVVSDAETMVLFGGSRGGASNFENDPRKWQLY